MRILRGIRMMMVRLITRATCHCEVRATCFPEGGVPTMREDAKAAMREGGSYRVELSKLVESFKGAPLS